MMCENVLNPARDALPSNCYDSGRGDSAPDSGHYPPVSGCGHVLANTIEDIVT